MFNFPRAMAVREDDAMSQPLTGSCLCGAVRFTVNGPLGVALNCQCGMCRKAHSAAYRSRVGVAKRDFAWSAGEELVTWYESSPTTRRGFCSRCGSRLVSEFTDDPESLGVPLALFDSDPGVRPQMHIHVASKAPWHEICDDLPQHEGPPPV